MEITQYSSKHCPACKEMEPELKKLKKAGFKVEVVDCEKDESKCKDLYSVPTLIIKKGNKSKEIVGFTKAEEIKEEFDKL